ncbi:MAG TPA: hypothetical protein VES88_12230 [Gemmatimonadaceae bacterium]|nr:hypothetical protein [Gemmatimonadaceae bacterium]
MQPRNIEVFDGLRITTDHFDHLQGSIHSALEDFRGILGLGRVHRGFGVTAVDEHSIQMDPGLAFDAQRRRVVSDEPVKLEVPAAIATAPQFVCLSYDQGADGEVEGHLTRVWDSARIDIRATAPAATDDAIMIAELQPAGGGGFTIRMGGVATVVEAADEETLTAVPKSDTATEPLAPRFAVRSGVFAMPDATVDRSVTARMASAMRAGASAGAPVASSERLASQEVLAGIAIATISIDAVARLAASPSADGEPGAGDWWRSESAGHGQGHVGDDGSIPQFGASMSTCHWPSGNAYGGATFAANALLTVKPAVPGSPDELARDAWLAGLRLVLRCVPRNGDGFAIDAFLEWEGQGNETIAAWLETWTGTLQWMAEGGWSAAGMTLPVTITPGG